MPAISDDAVLEKLEAKLSPVVAPEAPAPEEDSVEDTLEGNQEEYEGDDAVDDEREGEEDVPELDAVQKLTAALGLEEGQIHLSDDGQLYFNAKVDGEVTQLSAKDALKSLQLEGNVNRKSMELAEQRKQVEAERQQFAQQYSQRLEMANSVLEMGEDQLLKAHDAVDWESLKIQDPMQFMMKQQEFQQQASVLKSQREALEEQFQNFQGEQQQAFANQLSEVKQAETQKILAANPTWSDPAVRQQEVSALRDFAMNSYGFSGEEIDSIYDHRVVRALQDAQRFNKATTALKEKTKADKPIPEFRKPTSPGKRDTTKARAAKSKRQQLRKTGDVDDLASVLFDRIR